jgi:hypothetical protein
MTPTIVLMTIAVVILAVCGAAVVFSLIELRRTVTLARSTLTELDERLPPLMAKADATLDSLQQEIARADVIVESIRDVTQRVTSTADVAMQVLSSPLVKLAGLSAGMKKAVSTFAHPDDKRPEHGRPQERHPEEGHPEEKERVDERAT